MPQPLISSDTYFSHLLSFYENNKLLDFGRMNIEPTKGVVVIEGIHCEIFCCRLDYCAVSGQLKVNDLYTRYLHGVRSCL